MDSTSAFDDPRLALALTLAREGGRQALAAQGRTALSWKGPGDRVTATDSAIQSHIAREISDAFPDDGMIAEEQGSAMVEDHEFVWVVDPLDGTNNFVLGIPCFAVSIGILRAGLAYTIQTRDSPAGRVADEGPLLASVASRSPGTRSLRHRTWPCASRWTAG
jgi:fructose-1,6-bisphosphatase/inositol monophosphatase family enzyme